MIAHPLASPNLIAALLSGFLLFLSFPKFGAGGVAWIALVPLLFALRNVTPRQGFGLGFAAGLVAHVGILYWITGVVVQYGQLPVALGIGAMLLLAAYLSLYTALFASAVVFLARRGALLVLSAPALWTLLEYARSQLLTGFPWENLAYSQYLRIGFIQIADITGIYGVTFLIVCVNVVLYDLWALRLRKRLLALETAAIVVLVVSVYGYGVLRSSEIHTLLAKQPPLPVTLVQGNIDQNIKWDASYQQETLSIYRTLSLATPPAAGGLIVWPETAAPFYFDHPGPLRERMLDVARDAGRPILFGSPRLERGAGELFYTNSAYLLAADGSVAGRYDKVHLVPYGEYVPLRRYFPFLGKVVPGVGDFRPGDGYLPIEGNGQRIGVLICYEAIFPGSARAYKRRDAGLLVNITNDAWFGTSSAPFQHLSMTVFRAVESRLYLVRAANTGISAIVDPTGRIVARTGLFERTVLTGTVKPLAAESFYAAHGDWFIWLCGLIVITNQLIIKRRTHHA